MHLAFYIEAFSYKKTRSEHDWIALAHPENYLEQMLICKAYKAALSKKNKKDSYYYKTDQKKNTESHSLKWESVLKFSISIDSILCDSVFIGFSFKFVFGLALNSIFSHP